VIHTGDITQAKTLRVLAGLEAPLVGVFGNNDERESLAATAVLLGISLAEPPLHLTWHERKLVVVHDPRDLEAIALHTSDIALHGHTHDQVIERRDGTLIFNPGESAGHMTGYNAVGVIDLNSLETEILRF